jgi:hypothetical protein
MITRKLEFRAPAPDPQGGMMGPKLEDVFALPATPGWTVTRAKKDNELIVKASRTFKAGAAAPPDIVVKGAKGATLLTNTLSIKEVTPGRWEYKETLHWSGDRPDDMKRVPAEVHAALKEALPAGLATEENLQALGQQAFREVWRALFGPGEPLLTMILLHPDLAERKAMRSIGRAINSALVERFGDKLSQDQRGEIVRRIVKKAMDDTNVSTKAKADPQAKQQSDPGAMAAMMFVVKLPGKIVATNGEQDEITGEVYWALYAEAAAVGDVTMTATCETK